MQKIYWIILNRFDENINIAPKLEISKELIQNKFSVTLLTGYRKDKFSPKNNHVEIKYFKSINNYGLFKFSLSISIFIWLLRHLQQEDIVIISPDSLWIVFLLRKIKLFKVHLDIRTIPVEINDFKQKINYLLCWKIPIKCFYRYSDGFSFITESLKKSIETEFNLSFSNYVLWHSGVNYEHFDIVRRHRQKNNNHFIISYIGVVSKNRGINRVILALSKLKKELGNNILFQIIGSGPYLNNLQRLAISLGLSSNVIFRGYIPYESIPANIINTDIFICPLPDRHEWNVSSPIKIFEYLACARPIILTPIEAHKNIIQNSDYIIWTKSDKVSDISSAIRFSYINRDSLMLKAIEAPLYIKNKLEWKTQGKLYSAYLKNLSLK